ncbi:MAG: hypothetical protein M2R45_03269 [Verrucomicrobia subdivision 3 bacterium]|nr:hypothetical protein [Limisphaerales bacterium]MCS1416130.1 hypothetical protein [Limisphaerales bacterium]
MQVSLHDGGLRSLIYLVALLSVMPPVQTADNPFAASIRETDPLSPTEQQKTFHLPPGFKIELVAAEPDIAKPMNLAFDVSGRLWVTDSYEYPFAAPLDRPGRDSIKVFEDTNGDGRYDRTATFAKGLNIPIGLYPHKNGVIAWSIPNIWFFEDTNGDGVSDKRTKLYGPLGYERDTHGMNSSFTRGFDGWLYITHGFNNNTTIKASDGSEIFMNSGNTYRVRLDGSRVEHFTFGQVNPFGMAQDPLGDLYTSDCHSKPAYLLIRDAYYPSFGKPHDGLGFAPKIMEHSHGSTAIDGIVHYSDHQWPAEFRDNIFIGNVMTSRVNSDTLIEVGAGKQAVEEDDFIKSDDPWFRPVNMQFGPDGCLYIADYYNRIIGHYEVPLQHPGRDRHRGRIWKVSFTSTPGQAPQSRQPFDLTKLSLSGLFEELKSHTITRRQLAMNYLIDEVGDAALSPAKKIIAGQQSSNWQQRTHALWILQRLNGLSPAILTRAARDPNREVRVHSMKALSETHPWNSPHRQLAIRGLKDADFYVRRASADALGQHPDSRHITPLLDALADADQHTPFLRHALRIALRNQLREDAIFETISQAPISPRDAAFIADVSIAIKSPIAAKFLLDHLASGTPKADAIRKHASHIARYGTEADLDRLPKVAETVFPDNLDQQLAIHEALESGNQQRNAPTSTAIKDWGSRLAGRLIDRINQSRELWVHRPVAGMAATRVPWIIEARRSANGDDQSLFICSLSPGGESFTGVLTSRPFTVPEQISFYLAGHDGYPNKPAQGRNRVSLRLSANDQIIATAKPPRNDIAQPIIWNLPQFQGRKAYLEITDSDDAGAYAWLAFGRLSPDLVSLPALSPQHRSRLLTATARIVASIPESPLYQAIVSAIAHPQNPPITRSEMAVELSRTLSHPLAKPLAKRLADPALSESQCLNLGRQLFSPDLNRQVPRLIADLLGALPGRSQQSLIQDLTVNRNGAALLLRLAEEGTISPALLNSSRLREQFKNHGPQLTQRLESLTQDLPEPNMNLSESIQQLSRTLAGRTGNPEDGRQLFNQACQICHQLSGQGSLIGPQLDGIGNRGLERLLEDILDPNQNVDKAFQTQTLTLSNGDAVTGLHRREDGNLDILTNAAGQDFSVNRKSIVDRKINSKSLMPDNFIEILDEEQLSDLVTFLLASGN